MGNLAFCVVFTCFICCFALPRKRELQTNGLLKHEAKRSLQHSDVEELREIENLIRQLRSREDSYKKKELGTQELLKKARRQQNGERLMIDNPSVGQDDSFLAPTNNKRKQEEKKNKGKGRGTGKGKGEEKGKGLGHLFDIPEEIDPKSELEILLDSFVIERGDGREHKAKGIHRKLDYGDTHDHHKTHGESGNGKKRNFVLDATYYWPNKEIPYTIESGFTSGDIATINKGIQQFNSLTCVKWVPKATSTAQSWVEILNLKDEGCWSYIGYSERTSAQSLSLEAPGCMSVGTVVHELLHAAGADHEQSRSDRDDYIEILWQNINGGTQNNNFEKGVTHTQHPYDAQSVLQYSLRAASVNGLQTMKLKDWRLEFLVDSVDGFAFYDVKDVTSAYDCSNGCTDLGCQNAGFMNWQCKCYCPKDLTGPTCSTPVSIGSCGGTVSVGAGQEVYITTPNYPANYDTGLKCTWLVEGVADNVLRATIVDMDISHSDLSCYHWVEFRYNLLGQDGPRRCGETTNEIWDASKDEFKNKMIVQFESYTSSDEPTAKGVKIKFESIGTGCENHPCMFGSCNSPLNTAQYTCTCYPGFTGTNCDTPSIYASIGCTAEVGEYCMLSQNTDDDFDWVFQTEKATEFNDFGPNNAYEGWTYLYVDGYQQVQGKKAVMSTSLSFPNVDRCLRFSYFIWVGSSNAGTLNVYTENSQGTRNTVFTESSDHGQNWVQTSVDIPATDGLKVIFEVVMGSASWTDMALDDIWLIPGTCNSPLTPTPTSSTSPSTSTTTTTTPSTTTTTPTTTTTTPATSTTTPTTTTTTPTTTTTTTPTPTTTTPTTTTTTPTTTTTAPTTTTTTPTTTTITPTTTTTTPTTTTTTPSTTTTTPSTTTTLPTTTTTTSTTTTPTTTTTTPSTTTTTPTTTTTTPTTTTTTPTTSTTTPSTTTASSGTTTPFPVPYYANVCEFEPGEENCLFENTASNDNFDWTFRQGSTPSYGTGPDQAYTSSFYAYIEVSLPVPNYARALLSTENYILAEYTVMCVRFAYHMQGQPGTLKILVGNYGYSFSVVKTITGDHGASWQIDEYEIPNTYFDPVIKFEGSKGTSYMGDIALDRIVLLEQAC